MQIARMRDDEAAAMAALCALDVLDSRPEAEFDALVRAASVVCGAPISVISLVDAERQWFKANIGLPGVTETPRDVAFCAHAVLGDELFEVPDASRDPRFFDNPLVTGAPDIRFYAGAPVRLSGGERIGTICVIDRQPRQLDATQREVLSCLAEAAARALEGRRAIRANKAAAEQAARAALVLEHSADAIISVSMAGLVVRWNPAAERLFGHAAAQMVGRTLEALLPPELQREESDVLARLADGRAHSYETTRMHRDGRRVAVSVTAVPERDAEARIIGATKFVRDITLRRQAEQALKEQTERLRLAADSAGIGVWEFDPAGGTVNWDDWMFRLYNAQRADGLQPVELWSKHLHPDDAERVIGELTAALEGRGVYAPEFRIRWANGEIRHLQAAAHVLRDEAGQAVRMIGVNIDITKQRRSEEALREAKSAAEAANVAKSAFLANMSHEIRTPMNAILGMLALLQKTELTPRQADYTGKTVGAARALLGLLNDILDFSKVEAGKMTLDLHPFRIDQLLRDLSVILSANVHNKPVEVLFDIDPELPQAVVGDANRLRQVLINLGGNAIKFTERGEVVISVGLAARGEHDVTLAVRVRDSGIGIAPENHQRIFSGFTQAEATTTRRFGGTGLGLAICQRLVALMGGELRLDSELGQGSCFHFSVTLPLASIEDAELRTAKPGARPQALRTLIVDDNAAAREVLERMVTSLGWQADLADSGERALQMLDVSGGQAYDAVFVDWQMPGLDGWQTCLQIQQRSLAGTAPLLVMVTAHGREMLAQRSEAEQHLIDGFLVKPVTASMLHDAVVDALSGDPARVMPAARSVASTRRLAGLRLLVAEDNANNQQVARELLEEEGALVQIAVNGFDAVQAVAHAQPPFDAVLMDVQMPVMDGYTATSQIRQELRRHELPIVAMTANAMASDREACLAAGMNDHVGKPFDLDQLVHVLCRLVGRNGDAASPRAVTAATPAARAAAVDAEVDLEAAIDRLGGNLGAYRRMLASFIKDLPAMPPRLNALLQSAQTDEASRLMHTLKGVAATLGARGLAAQAGAAEIHFAQPAAQARPADGEAVRERVCAAIGAAQGSLTALLHTLQPASSPTPDTSTAVDRQAVQPELHRLAELLRCSDMAATEAVTQLRQRFGDTLGPQFVTLDEAIGQLDFDGALLHCSKLLETLQA